jgi:hypothetical protein
MDTWIEIFMYMLWIDLCIHGGVYGISASPVFCWTHTLSKMVCQGAGQIPKPGRPVPGAAASLGDLVIPARASAIHIQGYVHGHMHGLLGIYSYIYIYIYICRYILYIHGSICGVG